MCSVYLTVLLSTVLLLSYVVSAWIFMPHLLLRNLEFDANVKIMSYK